MKICTSYFQSEHIRNQVAEIRFSINALTPALEYAGRHADKKIIVEILTLDDDKIPNVNKLFALQQEHQNIYYDFYNLSDLVHYSKENARQPRHIMHHQLATTWGLIQILMYYNVSDISIDEPLTFDMPAIAENVKSKGIAIRLRPHIAKNRYEKEMENDTGLTHFWVLPQHVHLYEDYADVIDIIDNNSERETALVNFYLKGECHASLPLLIEGVEKDIGASFFDEKFAIRRLSCHQTCMKDKNKCRYCDQYVKMYDVIAAQHKSSN